MRAYFERVWYRPSPPPLVLRALSSLYSRVAGYLAAQKRREQRQLPVPVVVVGNISIGGTGKTPCVLWLVETLRALGRHPGVLSRGYRGNGPFPCVVRGEADPAVVGDEPALIARRSGVPVAVAPDRYVAGLKLLQAYPDIDVLVCDDGLQHYRLARDLEFCVVDGRRGFGNGWPLPAGPLREPVVRMRQVNMVLVNGGEPSVYSSRAVRFDLQSAYAVALEGQQTQDLDSFAGREVHAVAGIGDPSRFFDHLSARGIKVIKHAFPDHHAYRGPELNFNDGRPLLMTEKDAVKCRQLGLANAWSVPVDAVFTEAAETQLRELLCASL